MGKRVKCYGCHKPIHVDRFAGIMKARNGRTVYLCDALPCLLRAADAAVAPNPRETKLNGEDDG